jgi:phage/plasmid-associated DNA primase
MQTALFFGGKQGTGKNTFCNVLIAIVGEPYAICVSSIENVPGHFSSLIDQTLLITLDEVYVSPEDAGALKNFITGDRTCLVKRFHDAKFIPRFYSVLMCSNPDDAIPVEDGDRRFTCFYLSSSTRFRQKYFQSQKIV